MTSSENKLKGVLERIIFFNEENHYCIAEFRPDQSKEKTTIVGNLPGVQCGETLSLTGTWTRHPQHGAQFKVESSHSELPATVYGIRKYLGSGLVPGIGKVYANKIVDQFGLETFRVIEEESARLKTVPGIGKNRAQSIKAAWDEQSTLREIMVFLQTYGVTVSQCSRLVKKYGNEAKNILINEPYRVAREVDGIGFKTADKIAINIGMANDSPARLDAGLIYALEILQDEGHTAYPEKDLSVYTTELLQTDLEKTNLRIEALVQSHDLIRHNFPPINDSLSTTQIQLPLYDRAEKRISDVIHRLQAVPSGLPPIKIDLAVKWAQDKAGFAFSDDQAFAVRQSLAHNVFILTGGPGTGKTTILRAIVDILKIKKVRIHLAAPTGRAAQRLAETTGGFAQTIHRLLKFDPAKGRFTVNRDHPLNTDFLIVDEASMIDSRMAAALFQAVPSKAHLVLVGDTDQLPSIGAGDILNNLIKSSLIPVVRLSSIYRQKAWSLIVSTAHAINEGKISLPSPLSDPEQLDPKHDLQFISSEDSEDCLRKIITLCTHTIPQRFSFDPVQDIQVLAPMHKGTVGVGNLNQQLQESLNRRTDKTATAIRGPSGAFHPGDKIIQLRNNYDKNLFNGDIGRIISTDPGEGTLTANFDGQEHILERSDLNNLSLAYAISIHKSQGSEYPVVVIPLLKGHFMMLQRNLIYTAITRGKRKVIIVGETAAYAMAIRNAESKERLTLLRQRLLQSG